MKAQLLFLGALFGLGVWQTPYHVPKQIYFLHIAKAGGSTMHELLEKRFEPSDFYPFRVIGKERVSSGNPEHMIEVFREFPPIVERVLSGHFPIWFLHAKAPAFDEVFCFTCLREPVDRVISHYYFKRKAGQFLETPLDVPANLMCKMLCSDNSLEGEELLKNSIDNLRKLDHVMFLDDYRQGVTRLFKKLGLKPRKKITILNRTERGPVSAEMVEKIRELNALDVRLYDYAKTFLKDY